MTEREILTRTREMIAEHAGGDHDKWWYANRFVFARLQLDERKTKASVKQELLESGAPCHACGKPFESKRNVHLHRLNGNKGYSDGNCVLMHADCHQKVHATAEDAEATADAPDGRGRPLSPVKWSKRYEDMPFDYWWDVSPQLAESLDDFDSIEFVRKDTRERCVVPVDTLRTFLSVERRTTRGQGNWGIRVLNDRPDELAFEPGTGRRDWRFLPVVWLEDTED